VALYAIGDLHLSLGVNINKQMDVFGGGWVNYTEKIKEGFSSLTHDDICVLCGDISWGMQLEESLEDFSFIERLPGKKIILKGNHDYWWRTIAKMEAFFTANDIKSISILHNNSFDYEGISICGTRGWMTDDTLNKEQNEKVYIRENLRLRASLTAANPDNEKICFFHYPPRTKNSVSYDIISLLNEFGVKKCFYGHLHGEGFRLAAEGQIEEITYKLISADYINFKPLRITN